MVILASA